MSKITIGSYLLTRLHQLGLKHIFGIPGDYVLGLYELIEDSPIKHIGTTREESAGFAADAYARLHGIGGVCVTYCVGGLNIVNSVACAYAERSPVVVLSGSPGLNERANNPLMHHMVRDFATQVEVFEKITVAAKVIDDPLTAAKVIDEALAALNHYKRPIYLEIPRDLVNTPIELNSKVAVKEKSNPSALKEAVSEIHDMLASAKKPVILAGAEIHRFGLQKDLVKLVEKLNVAVASTLLGKSVIREDHPLYIGIYGGLLGRPEIEEYVSDADCLLMLGSILTDFEGSGAHTKLFGAGRAVHATADAIMVKHHRYDKILFPDFIAELAAAKLPKFTSHKLPVLKTSKVTSQTLTSAITLKGLFGYIDSILSEKFLVISDIGESLFASSDLSVHKSTDFLSPAYYASMGFAVPAAVGAGFAKPNLRAIVLVGDGAFQMTGTELSTCVRYGIAPIVIILNNRGYTTEREILDGPFNDIHNWEYDKVCELIKGGVGHKVATQAELVTAITAAVADPKQLHVLNVFLDPADRSEAMKRIAGKIAKSLKN